MSAPAIGIDLGGTRIKGVAISPDGTVLGQCYTPTSDSEGQPWKEAVKQSVDTLMAQLSGAPFVIGISAPGIPSSNNAWISVMPGRLQGLEGFHWGDFLGHSCIVVNDAIAAMAAEARFGEAKGLRNAVLITLGTGVGGALLINGEIFQGSFQKAGHIGHISVDALGEPDITGMPGSLEDAIGNCTLEKRSGGKYASTQQLLQDYRLGNSVAVKIWRESLRRLAIGMAGIDNIISPEKFILSGGLTEAGNDLFGPLQEYFDAYAWTPGGQKPGIVRARFGDMAGAIGAAGFAQIKNQHI